MSTIVRHFIAVVLAHLAPIVISC